MLKPNTALILGAAMSAEVGMPLGEGLKGQIADVLPRQQFGDDHVRDALFTHGDFARNVAACNAIRSALPKAASIDNLIEHRGHDRDFKHCAKVGIVAAILHAERKSDVYRAPRQTTGSVEIRNELTGEVRDTTYAHLFRLIVGNASVRDLAAAIGRVQVINFNYDRCLEHYFHDWLVGYSGLDQAQAWNLVDQLQVVRPYGGIGRLARLENMPSRPAVPFGAILAGLDLNGLADNILTFSEERGSEIDARVKQMCSTAEQVIFLGCAYHPQNLKLLKAEVARPRRFYGTCYTPPPQDKLSQPSLESFCAPTRHSFETALQAWPSQGATTTQFEPLTCRQLVAKYAPLWIDQGA